jgi:hypothetical protein
MRERGRGGEEKNAPAPVVPPAREDSNTPGDCWMAYSFPAMLTSTAVALGSRNPRFWEGMGCEKSRKVSK